MKTIERKGDQLIATGCSNVPGDEIRTWDIEIEYPKSHPLKKKITFTKWVCNRPDLKRYVWIYFMTDIYDSFFTSQMLEHLPAQSEGSRINASIDVDELEAMIKIAKEELLEKE